MTNLEQVLKEIHADSVVDTHNLGTEWDSFCEQYAALFDKVRQSKPDSSVTHHLLGILTKAHIESQTLIQEHQNAIINMKQVFEENLGEQHAARIENQSQKQLVFVTHLWLYLQGYLQMDFSLANDHAEQTANLITQISGLDSHALRTDFLGSFYQGIEHSPVEAKTNPILAWFKSLFH